MVSHDPRFQQVVDGLVLPASVGGHPALDFCNTRAGWNSPEPREYLVSYDHLLAWARAADLVQPGLALEDDGGILERALDLRGAIYRAATDPSDAYAWELVAAEAKLAAGAAQLVRGEGWVIPDEVGPQLPVLAVARAAGELLTSSDVEHVGRCPGRDCGWLYLDPRGRRRWCLMAVCGNREKARRHARKARR